MIARLNDLLQALQNESPNWGGHYHFSEIEVTSDKNVSLRDRLILLLSQNERYFTDIQISNATDVTIFDEVKLSNMVLTPAPNLEVVVDEKLAYWVNHKTSLDRFENATEEYPRCEKQFKEALAEYIYSDKSLKSFLVSGINTQYAFGGDHVNDDIIIDMASGVYVLHFGWSS